MRLPVWFDPIVFWLKTITARKLGVKIGQDPFLTHVTSVSNKIQRTHQNGLKTIVKQLQKKIYIFIILTTTKQMEYVEAASKEGLAYKMKCDFV